MIETYSVTLDSSQLYVPEWQVGMQANPSQLSTVLRGMVRNGCGENMKNVRLHFVVHDDAGKKGEASLISMRSPPRSQAIRESMDGPRDFVRDHGRPLTTPLPHCDGSQSRIIVTHPGTPLSTLVLPFDCMKLRCNVFPPACH
jgi:hypothetical protein